MLQKAARPRARRRVRRRDSALVLTPGVWVLRRLPFAGKIGVIALVLILPLGASVYGLLTSSGSQIRSAEREAAGAKAVVPLNALLVELAKYAGELVSGDAQRPTVGAHLRELDVAMSSDRLPDSLRADWVSFHDKTRAVLGAAQAPALEELVVLLQRGATLAASVGKSSGLSFDPAQRSHHLQMILVEHIPRLLAKAAESHVCAARWQKAVTTERAVSLSRLAADVAGTARDIQHAVRVAAATRPPLDSRLLAGTRELSAQSADKAQAVHLAVGERQLSDRDLVKMSDSRAYVTRVAQLLSPLAHELQSLLDHRIEQAVDDRRRPLVQTALSLSLVGYLLLALWRSTSRDLREVTARLEAAATLQPLRFGRPSGRDELATIAAAAQRAHRRINTLVDNLQTWTRHNQALVELSSDVTAVTDADGVIRQVSGSVLAVLGRSPALLTGRNISELVTPESREALVAQLQRLLAMPSGTGEVMLSLEDPGGRPRWLHAKIRNGIDESHIGGVLWNVRDVTEEQMLGHELRYRAFHDDLTGLPNRALFLELLGRALTTRDDSPSWLAVCVLDVDEFKGVNDSLGHAAGDDLLRITATRLAGVLRETDTVARLGGDEFGVFIEDLPNSGAGMAIARDLRDAVATPMELAGDRCTVSISVGIVCVEPGSRPSVHQVLHEADVAMYVAKASGRGRVRAFEPGMLPAGSHAAFEEVLALVHEDQAVMPVFQPLMDLASGTLLGFEALSRFPGREHRRVEEWFGLARRAGFGPQLEAKAISAALAVPGRLPGTYLTLNVSPSTLTSSAIDAVLPRDLTGLVIEVTEDSDIETSELAAAIIDLRRRGARIAVDDAGAGYAGLQRLAFIKPDIVKLDRQLIQEVQERPEKAALVEAMVGFCRRTNATLVAEGIETLAELVMLANLDVRVGQGWIIGRPDNAWRSVDANAAMTCDAEYVGALLSPAQLNGIASLVSPLRARLTTARTMSDIGKAVRVLADGLRAVEVSYRWRSGNALISAVDLTWYDRCDLGEFPQRARCLDLRRPLQVRVDDGATDPAEVGLLSYLGVGGALLVPVVYGEVSIGLLEIYTLEPRHWAREELSVIHAVVGAVAEAAMRVSRQSHGLRLVPPPGAAASGPQRT